MNKEQKIKLVEELKQEHKDNEEYTADNGKDYVRFNLGEINVPKGVKKQYLKVVPDHETGKSYLIFTMCLGMNEKVKEQRKQEREEKRQQVKQERQAIKDKVKQTNVRLNNAIKQLDTEKVTKLMQEKKDLEDKLDSLRIRKKKD